MDQEFEKNIQEQRINMRDHLDKELREVQLDPELREYLVAELPELLVGACTELSTVQGTAGSKLSAVVARIDGVSDTFTEAQNRVLHNIVMHEYAPRLVLSFCTAGIYGVSWLDNVDTGHDVGEEGIKLTLRTRYPRLWGLMRLGETAAKTFGNMMASPVEHLVEQAEKPSSSVH